MCVKNFTAVQKKCNMVLPAVLIILSIQSSNTFASCCSVFFFFILQSKRFHTSSQHTSMTHFYLPTSHELPLIKCVLMDNYAVPEVSSAAREQGFPLGSNQTTSGFISFSFSDTETATSQDLTPPLPYGRPAGQWLLATINWP